MDDVIEPDDVSWLKKPATTGTIDGQDDKQTRQNLLQRFQDTFTAHTLYKKEKRTGEGFVHVKVLEGSDNLINDGYFLKKETLQALLDATASPDGGIWINFAVGQTIGIGDEIQLVLTATDTQEVLASDDLGLGCATTTQVIWPTDPPYSGITSPKPSTPPAG